MAQMCHACQSATAVVRCVTEFRNLCLTCDYLRHSEPDSADHIRYQTCDECMMNPAILLCSDDRIVLCQSCYARHYNCVADGHRTQIINRFRQQSHNNTNNNLHVHENGNANDHMPQSVGQQRRERMFEMSCSGDNNCDRWMFAMNCESCANSNGEIYCAQHDKVLCENCDRRIHFPEAVLPHLRCMICVICKRPSRTFLIGDNHFNLPPSGPPPGCGSRISLDVPHRFQGW